MRPTGRWSRLRGGRSRRGRNRGVLYNDIVPVTLRRLAAAAALPLLLGLFHWRLLVGPRAIWYGGDDNANQVLPWLELQAREWRAGRAPLWSPYEWMGQPLPGQMQPAVTAPLHWLLLPLKRTPGSDPLFFNLYFLAIRWLGAAAMYRLARSLGCGRALSVAAGFAFAAVGWFAFQTRPQMAMSAAWAPLVLRYVLPCLQSDHRWREAVLGGFFLGLCWLGGHHQAPLFLSTGIGLAWAGLLVRQPRRWPAAALFLLTAAAAAALALLPAVEYGRRAVRWVGTEEPIGWREKIPYEIHRQYSLQPENLAAILWPGFQGKPELFLGLVLLVAGIFALAFRRARPAAAWLAAFGLLGVALSLGPAGGLHPLLYRFVPQFDKARAPEAALVLLAVTQVAMAALGLEQLARPESRSVRRAMAAVLWGGAAVAAMLARRSGAAGGPLLVSAAGAAVFGVLVLAAGRGWMRGPALAAAAAALLWIDASPLYQAVLTDAANPEAMRTAACLDSYEDVARFLHAEGGHWRVQIDDADVACNLGDWHALAQTHGYLASVTETIYRHELHTEWGQRLFGVRYRVGRRPSGEHTRKVFEGASGVHVWERDGVLPRAFSVHEAEQLPNRREAAGWLYQIRERMHERTFLPGPVPALERCAGPDSVRVAEYSPLLVRIEAEMACRGMVVLTDTAYPGWRATVDGRPAIVHEAYGAVRGVVAESGRHVVEFRYRPDSVAWGAALTGAAAGAAAFCARRRRIHW